MKILGASRSSILVTLAVALTCGTVHMGAQNATQGLKSSEAPAGNAEDGKRDFVRFGCYECHGREAQGSFATGPRLGPNPISFTAFSSYIRKPTREMPPYTNKVVSDQELADIYAFVRTRPRPPARNTLPK